MTKGHQQRPAGRRRGTGFTLLEVMIALAILGMSLTAITSAQQNSIRAANRAKWMTVATMLARYKMVEVEDDLFEEGFSDFDDEETGDFKDEEFEKYSYTLKVDKIELPANMTGDNLSNALEDTADDTTSSTSSSSSSSGVAGAQSGMAALGGKLLAKQFNLIRKVLEQSIRRVSLSVEWKEGTRTRAVTVVGYFTDPRKIDMAASGRLTTGQGTGAAAGASGASAAPAPARATPSGGSGAKR